jgi:hypothetical protein
MRVACAGGIPGTVPREPSIGAGGARPAPVGSGGEAGGLAPASGGTRPPLGRRPESAGRAFRISCGPLAALPFSPRGFGRGAPRLPDRVSAYMISFGIARSERRVARASGAA